MKDITQKDTLARHFAARGWYVQTEVPVFHKGGVQEHEKLITDVDVLALRPSPDLRWEAVLGDCKTLRAQSPANRVIWLRGLMQHFSATAGLVILRRRVPIDLDHKLLAASLGITLLDEAQFPSYDRALVYPEGSAAYPLSILDLNRLGALPAQFPHFSPLCSYLYGYAWNEITYIEVLRKVLGHVQAIAKEIDPSRPEHIALLAESAAVFSVGLADCVGKVFTHYLQPSSLTELDDALKIVIWGGRSQYNFIAKLRADLMAAKNIQPSQSGPLALPAWSPFTQLVRNMLEAPQAAFRIPQLLRSAALDIISGQPFLQQAGRAQLLPLKFAMLSYEYLCNATGVPAQARAAVADMFIKAQSDVVQTDQARARQSNSRAQTDHAGGLVNR